MSSDQIKELEYKIELLKNAVISEKHKKEELSIEVKELKKTVTELEVELEKRDQEIVKNNKEREALISQLDLRSLNKRKSEKEGLIQITEDKQADSKAEEGKYKNRISNFFSNLFDKDTIQPSTSSSKINIEQSDSGRFDYIQPKESSHNSFSSGSPYQYNNPSQSTQILKLEENINSLKSQNDSLVKLVSDSNMSMRKIKDDFQRIVNVQADKISGLETDLIKSKEQLIKYTQSTSAIINQNKSYEVKLLNTETTYKSLQEQVKICNEQIDKFQQDILDREEMLQSLKEANFRLQEDNVSLAVKLAELKNAILDDSVKEITFNGYRKLGFGIINLTFTLTKTKDEFFVAVIKEEGSKETEVILIDDIENAKLAEDFENSIELKYMKDKKIKTQVIHMNENVHRIIKSIRDFRDKSLKLQNTASI